jgi:hypothetical protein
MTTWRSLLIICTNWLVAPTVWAQPIDGSEMGLVAIKPQVIRADMGFLADDLLEGRAPGTRGYNVGAAYVASRFAALGLRAGASDGSYFQDVPLRAMHLDEAASAFVLRRRTENVTLIARRDFIISADSGHTQVDVEAPLIFVGHGITAPDQHYDDYAHLDVHNKIVIALYDSPAFADPSVRAHYSARETKRANAAAHGAIGFLALYSPNEQSQYPFDKRAAALDMPTYAWVDAHGKPNDYYPELKISGYISIPGADSLFAGTGRTTKAIFAAAAAGKLRGFNIPAKAIVRAVTTTTDISSANVIGILDGIDPALASQFVVYSAHLDHLGVGPAVNGDSIYNGALDNASGVAAILSVAEGFAHTKTHPRRSIIFIAVTGEEAGLLGSDYFARFPPVPATDIVADLTIDGGVPIWPIADVNAYGSEHSSILEPLRAAAERVHLLLSPDPHPEEVMFVRSDQYSFVRQGVPAVFISEGMQSTDHSIDTEKRQDDWWSSTYHEPSDDMKQPNLNFDSAALLAKLDFLTGWTIANDDSPPRWNKDDFFGRLFGRNSQIAVP